MVETENGGVVRHVMTIIDGPTFIGGKSGGVESGSCGILFWPAKNRCFRVVLRFKLAKAVLLLVSRLF